MVIVFYSKQNIIFLDIVFQVLFRDIYVRRECIKFVDADNRERKTAGLYLSFCIILYSTLCYFQVKKLNQDRINSVTMLKIDSTLRITSEQLTSVYVI